jgi:Brp/Blh family beta-carotene 15,15'-monooxygenase
MLQIILILVGLLLLITQQFFQPFSDSHQLIFFLIGIVFLGVPHGAADLLVAIQNERAHKKSFSRIHFFANYLGRLIIFAAILWSFPLGGIFFFIVFAAYHFGETDLHQYKTDLLSGKIMVTAYGMLIMSVLLLNHLDEVKPIISYFDSGNQFASLFSFLESNSMIIITFSTFILFVIALFYVHQNKIKLGKADTLIFLRFICILLFLYKMPLVLGFTFYFILWHSLISLNNIIEYLKKDMLNKPAVIFKQIFGYSSLAIGGIVLIGSSGLMFLNSNSLMSYIFMGLAVLTAPHMQIMHEMYNKIRSA